MRPCRLLAVVFAVSAAGAFADDRKAADKYQDTDTPLKERRKFNGLGSWTYRGVVTEIDKDALVIDGPGGVGQKQGTYKFHALDLHKAGEVQEWASSWGSYRWQDVKVGDTVEVQVVKDQASSALTPYVYEICIRRRPDGKLPEGQKPKEDQSRWAKDSLLNDIDNGEDKTEEEIAKLFPPRINPQTGKVEHPGGLPPESREKLTANRKKLEAEKEKKEQELKANPPKKDDKK